MPIDLYIILEEDTLNTIDVHDVVIIGGGPGGLAAGLYCMRAVLKTVLLEKGIPGGQIAISKEVENYPGIGEITGYDLAERMAEQAKSHGLAIVQKEVVNVAPGSPHLVTCSDGAVYGAHALILAMGGSPNRLKIPGELEFFGTGVSYCGTCDGFFFRDRTVAVIGGGDTALEEALYLSKLASKVFLIHRRDSLRAGRILQNRLRAEPKIEVILDTIPREIKGDADGVKSIALVNKVTGSQYDLPVDGVFIFIGYSPDSQLVPDGVEINRRGFVVTDEKCETSIPGIFAIGDLRQKYANQIVIAASDGCIAALAASHYVENLHFAQGRENR